MYGAIALHRLAGEKVMTSQHVIRYVTTTSLLRHVCSVRDVSPTLAGHLDLRRDVSRSAAAASAKNEDSRVPGHVVADQPRTKTP